MKHIHVLEQIGRLDALLKKKQKITKNQDLQVLDLEIQNVEREANRLIDWANEKPPEESKKKKVIRKLSPKKSLPM